MAVASIVDYLKSMDRTAPITIEKISQASMELPTMPEQPPRTQTC